MDFKCTHTHQVLPFPMDVISQLDYNSRLRLAVCFCRLKTLTESGCEVAGCADDSDEPSSPGSEKQIIKRKTVPDSKPVLFQPGMLQDLMTEVSFTLCSMCMYVHLFCGCEFGHM